MGAAVLVLQGPFSSVVFSLPVCSLKTGMIFSLISFLIGMSKKGASDRHLDWSTLVKPGLNSQHRVLSPSHRLPGSHPEHS